MFDVFDDHIEKQKTYVYAKHHTQGYKSTQIDLCTRFLPRFFVSYNSSTDRKITIRRTLVPSVLSPKRGSSSKL